MTKTIDLLKTIEHGGCSAKIPAGSLSNIVSSIPVLRDENLLVGNDTSDDAMVYKVNEETVLIQTTDFFPPVCSDPFDFGQIAAANALSDVYAMGGDPITALNIVMFPWGTMEEEVLKEILAGGAEKVIEAGAVLGGGHTIEDPSIKYGLAVTGTAHPDNIIKNSAAQAGEVLILTKPIGTAVVIAGKKIDEISQSTYNSTIETMKQLNDKACHVMKKYGVKAATDITGFSLCGHSYEMAKGSNVQMRINSHHVPMMKDVYEMINLGCIPTASFRNLKFMDDKAGFASHIDYNLKMLLLDAQTSGGILMSVKESDSEKILGELIDHGYEHSSIIGEVVESKEDSPLLQII